MRRTLKPEELSATMQGTNLQERQETLENWYQELITSYDGVIERLAMEWSKGDTRRDRYEGARLLLQAERLYSAKNKSSLAHTSREWFVQSVFSCVTIDPLQTRNATLMRTFSRTKNSYRLIIWPPLTPVRALFDPSEGAFWPQWGGFLSVWLHIQWVYWKNSSYELLRHQNSHLHSQEYEPGFTARPLSEARFCFHSQPLKDIPVITSFDTQLCWLVGRWENRMRDFWDAGGSRLTR